MSYYYCIRMGTVCYWNHIGVASWRDCACNAFGGEYI